MRSCMLINPSGLPGHWMGIDMNIEHLIGYLKVCLCAEILVVIRSRVSVPILL
jgi:hypothetical protein